MGDVLAFTVPTFHGSGFNYPSVNELIGPVKGKKTPEYHDLKIAVREAARAEMERTGWVTATYYVDLFWKRYVTSRRGFDPMNCLKCESDSMEPDPESGFAGVYVNDKLVRPHVDLPQYDSAPDAIDRIAIAVFRLYPTILDAPKGVAKPRAPKAAPIPHIVQTRAVVPTGPQALLNGVPISREQALALIGREGDKRR